MNKKVIDPIKIKEKREKFYRVMEKVVPNLSPTEREEAIKRLRGVYAGRNTTGMIDDVISAIHK